MTTDESHGDDVDEGVDGGSEGPTPTPHPEEGPDGNYRPIDGPLPGVDQPEETSERSGSAGEHGEDSVKRRFVDEVRKIEVPGGDPVSAGILTDLVTDDGVITATVDCSTVSSTVAHRVGSQMAGIGFAIEGVEHVRLESPRTRMPDGRIDIDGVDAVLAVAGAKGGTGKSTLTVTLAKQLADAGVDVGIFDADFEAPDVAELVGLEEPLPPTAGGNPEPATVDGIQVVTLDLITGDRPLAWRGAMTHDVLEDLLRDAAWQERDVLLVDLPPGLGEVQQRLFQRIGVHGAILVTTPADTSLRNVERTAGLLDAYDVPVAAVVENMIGSDAIRSGERTVEELLDVTPGDPSHVTIPFSTGFQGLLVDDGFELPPEGESAVSSLTTATEQFLETASFSVPEDAIDLSGLPPRLQEKQAVLEVAVAGESTELIVDSEDVVSLVAEENDGSVSVSDVGASRQLVRAGGDSP